MNTPRSLTVVIILAVSACVLTSCHRSSGSPEPIAPDIPASIPSGAGEIAISMEGVWEVRNSVVLESNLRDPTPPPEGTQVLIGRSGVVEISGVSQDPFYLSLLFGIPVQQYVNEVTDRTIFYGFAIDRRSSGGELAVFAVAGGALDANTLSIESYEATQSAFDQGLSYVISRYLLVRSESSGALGQRGDSGDLQDPERSLERLITSF